MVDHGTDSGQGFGSTESSSAANITLKYPADNGAVPGGKRVQVMWFSNNTAANSVIVEVAEDGATWKTLASGKPSNGTADWDIPATDFPGAKVRVTGNTTGGPISATASNVFIDSTLPDSFVHDMGGYKRCIDAAPNGGKVYLPFSAWDTGSSGIWYVELWWRIEHRGGEFAEAWESRTNKSPFIFDTAKEGTYELYSIAVDRAGNREKEKYFNDTSVTLDIDTPQVFASFPEPDTWISFWPSFQIMFSEKMNTTDTAEIRIDPPGPQPVRVTWDELYSRLSFAIDRPLVPGQHYNITISGMKDKCGKPMLPATIHFKVANPPFPGEGNISGQVVHAFTQEPVSDATVEAWYQGTDSLIRTVKSDAGGLFTLERIPPTAYRLSFRASGFQDGNLTATLDPDGRPFIKLELVPEGKQPGWLAGQVTDARGLPVEGALLTSEDYSRATSDRSGGYMITLREGKHLIRVFKEGHPEVAFEVEVKAGETLQRDVALVRTPGPGLQPWQTAGLGVAAGAGAVATLFLLGGEAMKLALLLVPIALYSRVKREGVLDHFVRGKIYGFVVAQPGVRYTSLLRSLKLANGTASYHLYVLEREGLIKSVREGGIRRFFPKDAPAGEGGVILSKVQQAILDLVGRRPGITQKDMRSELLMPHQNVSYNVRRLVSMGVLNFRWAGFRKNYFPKKTPEPDA
ncbi:MAG TPA: carboxypeptidase regulatory-like domain-containing protein [Thermoplasmata archaeon]|nr:carboxypeptidase regulatory-like domain-containing protein [Thermoplasmata archaeon]